MPDSHPSILPHFFTAYFFFYFKALLLLFYTGAAYIFYSRHRTVVKLDLNLKLRITIPLHLKNQMYPSKSIFEKCKITGFAEDEYTKVVSMKADAVYREGRRLFEKIWYITNDTLRIFI